MRPELMELLKKVNNDSFIGLCIHQILYREEELQALLKELKAISRENPEIMISIIGKEAYQLLVA